MSTGGSSCIKQILRQETGKLGVNWEVEDQIGYCEASVKSKSRSVQVTTIIGFLLVLMGLFKATQGVQTTLSYS